MSSNGHTRSDVECPRYPSRRLQFLILGHPEFNQIIVEFLLQNRHFRGLFNDEVFEEAFPKAAEQHDGVKVGEGIMNFIMGVDYT